MDLRCARREQCRAGAVRAANHPLLREELLNANSNERSRSEFQTCCADRRSSGCEAEVLRDRRVCRAAEDVNCLIAHTEFHPHQIY